jgi:hypothetical protein
MTANLLNSIMNAVFNRRWPHRYIATRFMVKIENETTYSDNIKKLQRPRSNLEECESFRRDMTTLTGWSSMRHLPRAACLTSTTPYYGINMCSNAGIRGVTSFYQGHCIHKAAQYTEARLITSDATERCLTVIFFSRKSRFLIRILGHQQISVVTVRY